MKFQKTTKSTNFQPAVMKPTKSERRRFSTFSFFFILFLFAAAAAISELRLKFGRYTFFSHKYSSSSSAAGLAPRNSTSDDIRIFIGILTLPDHYYRRHFLRMIYGTQSPAGATIDVKFVFCNLTKEDQQVMVALEIMRYDDIIILNCPENMNNGKTYTYFSSLPEILNSPADTAPSPASPYHYVMKADDDIFLRLDKLVESVSPLPREDLYYGFVIPCGNMDPFRHYMAGMGYLVSWDIVEWVRDSEIPRNHLDGSEDRVFGDWLRQGRRGKNRRAVQWAMYNYPNTSKGCTHELWADTIGVHLLKKEENWISTLKYFNFTNNLKPSKLYHLP